MSRRVAHLIHRLAQTTEMPPAEQKAFERRWRRNYVKLNHRQRGELRRRIEMAGL